ncbi:MAG: alkaline phosphatase family protein, partial [Gemmatimonadota bacterium]|nr:alkaline phosphatase family protein [Gemmatimonadota bacterium]
MSDNTSNSNRLPRGHGDADHPRLSVCYVPGLDSRRITADVTPFIHAAVARYPTATIDTIPITELVPSMLTGVGPEAHGYWQMRLHPDASRRRRRLVDLLPDRLTTFAQCLVHLVHPAYDMTAIPPRRRRRFVLTRFKYTRRQQSAEIIGNIGGFDSIIGALGPGRARYIFSKRLDELDVVARGLTEGSEDLVFAEVYGLDLLQHWSLDQPERLRDGYARIDAFVADLHARAAAAGRRLLLLVDHGQEPVRGTIDLPAALRRVGVPDDEYTWFIDVPMARFWFHTDRARDAITAMLRATPNGRTLEWSELARYGVAFENADYGELYFAADPGFILFPHDFYHPVANAFLGMRDPQQRPRVRNPHHRGSHGHLPGHPSERGYMVVFDDAVEVQTPAMALVDVAPTLLQL